MSGLAVEQAKERLQHFLESKKVASLHLGNHQTATLREVEARNLTEYLARAILETREQRDHRHSVKSAARDHHGRLVNDFNKASDYHAAARELASEVIRHLTITPPHVSLLPKQVAATRSLLIRRRSLLRSTPKGSMTPTIARPIWGSRM